jgi:GNAT superfamily N-acetyltransferase
LVSIRELKPSDVAHVDQFLPLSRLTEQAGEAGESSTYLIAWDGREPVGHTHIAWTGTHLAIPEIQDVFVLPERRRRGIASQLTQAAEAEARKRGWGSISLSVSQQGNAFAWRLYTKLGYVEAPTAPVRVLGVIVLRGQPVEVDDTLVYLTKRL